jgi:hypothetical protein
MSDGPDIVHVLKEIYIAIVTNLPVLASSALVAGLVAGWYHSGIPQGLSRHNP